MSDIQSESYVLAIDLGTHGPKVGLVSERGEVIGWEFEPTPYYLLPGGGAEQNPDEWWQAIVAATRRLLNRNLVPIERILAVGPSAQWCGTVAVDIDGKPLMNAIIWMDSRGAPYSRKINAGFPSIRGYGLNRFLPFWYYFGGSPGLNGKDALGHILYIQNERPEVYRQTYKFLEVKDYINLRLTGKAAASVDSIGQTFLTDNRNLKRVEYQPWLLKLAGMDREKLPDLYLATDILGPLSPQAAGELGLCERTVVALGSADIHSTAIGAGGVDNYQAHLYLGTSSWLICHVPFKKTDINNFMASLPSSIPGRYLLLNEQDFAAGCLDFFLENFAFPQDTFACSPLPEDAFERLDKTVQGIPPGSEKVIFTPWLYGERTPLDDAYARGCFFNLSPGIGRGHLARAIMEGVAFNGRMMLKAVEKFCQRRLDPIQVVGGGALSDTWLQIHADVFGRTLQQVKNPRLASLRGAAFIALAAIGRITFEEVPRLVEIACTFRPNPDHYKLYDELFREFVDFYRRNKRAYTRLNRTAET
jgi:xylulokinase